MSNKLDVHQHVWTEELVDALARRAELPFVRFERGLPVVYLEGERPFVIDLAGESAARRSSLFDRDGIDAALVCISSPLGIEWLPGAQARPLLDAYHTGAHRLGRRFGVWGAIALDDADPGAVDNVLDDGCVGVSLPADALASVDALGALGPILSRLETRDAPLFVHPGAAGRPLICASDPHALRDPLWWPALTSYVGQMQCAWLAFACAGRAAHPRLRVVFSMLAGLAPLQSERLRARGGSPCPLEDPLLFYDTSSYGSRAIGAVASAVGASQLLYGSDRPVVDPAELGMPGLLDWGAVGEATRRAIGAGGDRLGNPPSLRRARAVPALGGVR